MILLNFLFLIPVFALESTRLMITFHNSSVVDTSPFENLAIIKQYGRRVLLDLGDSALNPEEVTSRVAFVQMAEIDPVVGSVFYSDSVSADLVGNGTAVQHSFWNMDPIEPYGIHLLGNAGKGNPAVVVAVLDSGLAAAAFDAFQNVGLGYDFISDPLLSLDNDGRDSNFTDPGDAGPTCPVSSWHGTRVSSIIAAKKFMPSIAPNCTLLPVRVLGLCRVGYASDVADAIVWAAGGWIKGLDFNARPAKVISMSFSGKGQCPSYLQSAVNTAKDLGSILITASGNDGLNTTNIFPANCIGVITVAASTREGRLARYSNYGEDVSVAAPGGDRANPVATLSIDGGVVVIDFGMGTSFSVPHVSGIAALALNGHNGSDIVHMTRPFGVQCFLCGSGIIDASSLNNEHGISGDGLEIMPNASKISIYSQFLTNNSTIHAVDCGFSCAGGWCARCNQVAADWMTDCPPACASYQYATCSGGTRTCNQCPSTTTYDYYSNDLIYYDASGYKYMRNVGQCVYSQAPSGSYRGLTDPLTPYSFVLKTSVDYFPNGPIHVLQAVTLSCVQKGVVNAQPYFLCSEIYNLWWYVDTWKIDNRQYKLGGSVSLLCGPEIPAWNANTQNSPPMAILLPFTTSVVWYLSCPAGKFTGSPGLGACDPCPAGTYNSGTGKSACSPCAVGFYSGSGALSCTACPAGTYQNNPGSGSCVPCSSGYYSTGTANIACLPCAPGYYAPSTGLGMCPACGAGTFQTGSATSVCARCSVGNYVSTTASLACVPCGVGTYAATTGLNKCVSCAAGKYQTMTGTTTCIACSIGATSAVGATSCFLCSAGYISTAPGAGSCSACASGTYQTGMGQSTCAVCPVGLSSMLRTCVGCAAGKYGAAGVCNPCAAGTFAMFVGTTSCQACPVGTGSVAGASTCTTFSSVSTCRTAANGLCPSSSAVCVACGGGSYNDGSTKSCTKCGPGKYTSVVQATAASSCLTCEIGYTTSPIGTGYSACLTCVSNSQATPINAQFVKTTDPLVCMWACNAGYQRFNYSVSTNIISGYTAAQSLMINHVISDYCCNPTLTTLGTYISSCSRSSEGNVVDCPSVANGYFFLDPLPKLNRCSDWQCNQYYYALNGVCLQQPSCGPGYTYQRDSSGALPSDGGFTCVPCSVCMDGAEVSIPCNKTYDTQCRLCSQSTFSQGGVNCTSTPPFGYGPVRVRISTTPVFQGRASTFYDGTPIAWDSKAIYINTYTKCQPLPSEKYTYAGGDAVCQKLAGDPNACLLPMCNVQCKPWNGTMGWYLVKDQCYPCVYDVTCSNTQYSDMTTCGPTSSPQCKPCPDVLLPNSLAWVNPGKPPSPGDLICTPICKDGFIFFNNSCIPCRIPPNAKVVRGCNWTCSLGFVLDQGSCIPCTGVPVSCGVGMFLGYSESQCARCLPCTNLIQNSFYTSAGAFNGPNTCGLQCKAGTYVSSYGFDAFNNPILCNLCSAPLCVSGKTYLSQCSYTADAQCIPCSKCSPGFQMARVCTIGTDILCTPCDNSPPQNASWTAPECMEWRCDDGFYALDGQCFACKQAKDCLNSDSFDESSGCGICTPCNTSLLLPGQCFNGDGQCGVSYLCENKAVATYPPTTTTTTLDTTTTTATTIITTTTSPSTTPAPQYASVVSLSMSDLPSDSFISSLTSLIAASCPKCTIVPRVSISSRRRLLDYVVDILVISPGQHTIPELPVSATVVANQRVLDPLMDPVLLVGYVKSQQGSTKLDLPPTSVVFILSFTFTVVVSVFCCTIWCWRRRRVVVRRSGVSMFDKVTVF